MALADLLRAFERDAEVEVRAIAERAAAEASRVTAAAARGRGERRARAPRRRRAAARRRTRTDRACVRRRRDRRGPPRADRRRAGASVGHADRRDARDAARPRVASARVRGARAGARAMTAVAARARGLVTRMLSVEVLADLARGADRAALARLGLGEERRSRRASVRGLAAGMATHRRLASAVATPRLPARTLEQLAAAPTLAAVAAELADAAHPYARVIAAAALPIDLFALELALAHRFAELAAPRDGALRVYFAQLVDADNTAAALAIATRGRGLTAEAVDAAFVPGGRRVTRAVFRTACSGDATAVLAKALAGTPLAAALFAATPGALEGATLAWP